MDFIERIFGVSPDGGSGSLEAAILLVPFVAYGAFVAWSRWRRRSTASMRDKRGR
jgi:hypothetical protein